MGVFIDTDKASGKETHTETFTCPHHNTIHPLRDENGRRLDVALCRRCRNHRGQPKPVCDRCVMIETSGGNMCVPIEKRFDGYEKATRQAIDRQLSRHDLLRRFGL